MSDQAMTDHDDFAFEPVRGLPALPPKGETVLWQGRPSAPALAWHAYGLRWVALYFAAILIWRCGAGFVDAGLMGAVVYGIPHAVLGLIAAGIIYAMAWVQARSTVYTITSSRVAMRIGAALTVTLNVPYTQIASAGLDLRRYGNGTIALVTKGETRLSYLMCWPHVRPWHANPTQPALRCIPDAARIAKILADAAETRVAQPAVSRANPPFSAIAAE